MNKYAVKVLPNRVKKTIIFLVKNFNKPIKLEEVAAVAGLTPTAFCRYLK